MGPVRFVGVDPSGWAQKMYEMFKPIKEITNMAAQGSLFTCAVCGRDMSNAPMVQVDGRLRHQACPPPWRVGEKLKMLVFRHDSYMGTMVSEDIAQKFVDRMNEWEAHR